VNSFDAGQSLIIEFSKKLIVTQYEVEKKVWSAERQGYEIVKDDEGEPILITETRIKLPASSNYRGFIFNTQDQLFPAKKIKYNLTTNQKEEILSDTMLSMKVFRNVQYKLTRTPYVKNEAGEIEKDELGRNKLNFSKQETLKLSGVELKKEMDSWKIK